MIESMTTPETQPAASKPERRPFQYGLRSLFGLTCGTAVFFSVARMLGYVDAVVILAGIVVLVGVIEWPRLVRLPTGIMLAIVAGVLLWANLRQTGWQAVLNEVPPRELDSMARSMFYRGWPLYPFATCPVHGMRFDASEVGVYWILALNGLVFVSVLIAVRRVGEFCFRRRNKPIIVGPRIAVCHHPCPPDCDDIR